MAAKGLYQQLLTGNWSYDHRDFMLRLAGQAFLMVSVFYSYIQMGAVPGPIPLAGLFLFSVLFWRRKWDYDSLAHTHVYMAAQTVISTLIVFQDFTLSCMFVVLAGQSAVVFSKMRTSLIWSALLYFIVLIANFSQPGDDLFTPTSRAVAVIAVMVISGFMSASIGRTRREHAKIQDLLTELNEANSRLRKYARQAEFLSTAAERERIARDLHDTLGHRLTVAVVQLEGAERLMERDPHRVAGMLETVRSQLMTGLDELRQTLLVLRGHNVTSASLIDSLQKITEEFANVTGIDCHRRLPDMLREPLSDEQCMAIYRIVQETLTNTQKHAQAQNVWVELESSDDALILKVRNDGRDFDPSKSNGLGLQGMQERAAQLGGDLRVTTPAAGGTLVLFSLPIGINGTREFIVAESQVNHFEVMGGAR